jgi:hypothetical protein
MALWWTWVRTIPHPTAESPANPMVEMGKVRDFPQAPGMSNLMSRPGTTRLPRASEADAPTLTKGDARERRPQQIQ